MLNVYSFVLISTMICPLVLSLILQLELRMFFYNTMQVDSPLESNLSKGYILGVSKVNLADFEEMKLNNQFRQTEVESSASNFQCDCYIENINKCMKMELENQSDCKKAGEKLNKFVWNFNERTNFIDNFDIQCIADTEFIDNFQSKVLYVKRSNQTLVDIKKSMNEYLKNNKLEDAIEIFHNETISVEEAKKIFGVDPEGIVKVESKSSSSLCPYEIEVEEFIICVTSLKHLNEVRLSDIESLITGFYLNPFFIAKSKKDYLIQSQHEYFIGKDPSLFKVDSKQVSNHADNCGELNGIKTLNLEVKIYKSCLHVDPKTDLLQSNFSNYDYIIRYNLNLIILDAAILLAFILDKLFMTRKSFKIFALIIYLIFSALLLVFTFIKLLSLSSSYFTFVEFIENQCQRLNIATVGIVARLYSRNMIQYCIFGCIRVVTFFVSLIANFRGLRSDNLIHPNPKYELEMKLTKQE